MVGPWSDWGSCRRNGQTCGYKYGIAARSRSVLEAPSPNGDRCPSLTENVCCRMRMRHCAGIFIKFIFYGKNSYIYIYSLFGITSVIFTVCGLQPFYGFMPPPRSGEGHIVLP